MILLNAVIKPVWIFGIDRHVQLQAGQVEYGKYFALLNLTFIFNIILDLGVTGYVNRTAAARHSSLPEIAYQSFIGKLFFSFFYFIIIFSVAYISGAGDYLLLFLLCLVQVITSFLLWGRGMISAMQLFKTDSWLSVADKALMILFAGIWLYTPLISTKITVTGFVWIQLIAVLLAFLLCIYFLTRQSLFGFTKTGKWTLIHVIKESWPYAVTVFFMGLHNRADAFLLERFHTNGPHETGIYAAAYRLLDAGNMVGYLFATILVSYWAKHAGEKPVIQKSLALSHQLLIPAGILAACVSLFLHRPLYNLLYHHGDSYADEILKWCLVTVIPFFITHLYGTLLTATGRIKILMWLVIISALINFIANLFFVPVYGAKACVFIALFTQMLLALATIYFCRSKMNTDVKPVLWIQYLAVGIITAVVLFALEEKEISIWIKLGAAVLAWFISINLFRIFSVKSFLKLIREN